MLDQRRNDTRVDIFFNVDNVGDRGAQLKTLDISFKHKDMQYVNKMELENYNLGKTFVDAHKSMQIECHFVFSELRIASNAILACVFTLHHTHNKETFRSETPYPKASLSKEWKSPS